MTNARKRAAASPPPPAPAGPLTHVLPDRLSVRDDGGALTDFLAATAGKDATLDAGALRRLDTPLLQTLLAAAADRRRAGARLSVTGLSPALAAQAALLGVTPDHLDIGGAA